MINNLIRSVLRRFFENISVTVWIIVVNVLLFILFSILIALNPSSINYIALKPGDLMQGKIWLLITSMFMHAGFIHLFMNMFSLWFIGRFLEKVIGRKRFFWVYLFSGALAGLIFSFFAIYFGGVLPSVFGDSNTLAVGASGALFGLLGVLVMLTPKAKVYLIAGPLIALIVQSFLEVFSSSWSNTLSIVISIYFFVSLFALISFNKRLLKIALPLEMPFWILPIVAIIPLVAASFFVSLPIGNTAHFGGLIAGLVYGYYLRLKYHKKVMLLNRMIHT